MATEDIPANKPDGTNMGILLDQAKKNGQNRKIIWR
jgi:hypothetical protein